MLKKTRNLNITDATCFICLLIEMEHSKENMLKELVKRAELYLRYEELSNNPREDFYLMCSFLELDSRGAWKLGENDVYGISVTEEIEKFKSNLEENIRDSNADGYKEGLIEGAIKARETRENRQVLAGLVLWVALTVGLYYWLMF